MKKKSSRRRAKSTKRGRSRSDSPACWEDNPCKHCRKYKRTRLHPGVPEKKCMWNPKYKGFRFQPMCKKMGIKYKPRRKFPPELGGYPDDSSSSGSDS